ncbi:flagellar basal body-associated FliL family protein [Alicyclobacillus acidocaldarius]|uniref:Flagellar protein FliL n=1 Tax=Alicyclobacillus acidocaldarius (strain Tc-4-1) TaxID=1048834 RepID=F8IHY5_ALIAT|nr:flagellar basal body-associated FliL family protein [Alicyclobacillus acidocaldarius]AEJ43275.1 flagellar basal body-associated protein FliL [Alicyclobacillus acidocaldarius subsp. acidocaldarius Tc-4-1]
MKKAVRTMLMIVLGIVVIAGAAIGYLLYSKKHHAAGGAPPKLSAKQMADLQVTLPQMTTNLAGSGIIQFTLTLQADSKSTKNELNLMEPQISDAVNGIMREFTSDELRTDAGLNRLKATIVSQVNRLLPAGKVTAVYLSQVLVQ